MGRHSDTADKIITALAEYLKRDPATIQPTDHLRDNLGLDSMAVIELLYRIEETFNLQIPDQDLPNLTSVQQVISYVEKRLHPSQPAQKPGKQPAAKRVKKRS
ncbi:MAG: acyl carrier protein [Nitrospiraceae bacterium]